MCKLKKYATGINGKHKDSQKDRKTFTMIIKTELFKK